MDNAQKAIMIGVGLFITIIIISAVLLITNIGTDLINNARNQMSSISKSLQNQVTAAFDGKTVTGSDVIAACQQYENSDQISVRIVVTKKSDGKEENVFQTGKYAVQLVDDKLPTAPIAGGIKVTYTGEGSYKECEKDSLSKIQDTSGVSGTQTYYSYVMKDKDSDTVMGVLFVRKGM